MIGAEVVWTPTWQAQGFPAQPSGRSPAATTRAPWAAAMAAVASVEPSSTTTISAGNGTCSATEANSAPIEAFLVAGRDDHCDGGPDPKTVDGNDPARAPQLGQSPAQPPTCTPARGPSDDREDLA